MSADTLALGVDIGGTKIAFALVSRRGDVLAEHRLPTLASEGAAAVLDRIAEGIHHLAGQSPQPVAGIGVGCPGLVNPITGVCHHAVNLNWWDVPLRDEIQRRLALDVPVAVHRDTNAGTIGEWIFGAAQGERSFAYAAIGTGMGMGAVTDGRLLLGSGFLAMEFGHTVFNPQGRLCQCGQRGCGEAYISGTGLLAGYREHLPDYPQSRLSAAANVTVNDILAAGFAGDPLAVAIMEEAADYLALMLACCVGTIDPGLFIIGGGLGLALYDWMLPRLTDSIRTRLLPVAHDHVRIARSRVTSSAVGAAALVWLE